jgi:uncharacterized membrane-anchored protein YhcB (DUF1043 family)
LEDNTGFLTLLMNFVGPLILGLAILYLILRVRGVNWRQRQRTEQATEDLYDKVDESREDQERADRAQARKSG